MAMIFKKEPSRRPLRGDDCEENEVVLFLRKRDANSSEEIKGSSRSQKSCMSDGIIPIAVNGERTPDEIAAVVVRSVP